MPLEAVAQLLQAAGGGQGAPKVRAVNRTETLREQLQDETTRQVLALSRDRRQAESAVYEKLMIRSDTWLPKIMDSAGEEFHTMCTNNAGVKQIPPRMYTIDKVLDAALGESEENVSDTTKAAINQYQEWTKTHGNAFVMEVCHFSRKQLKTLTPKQHLVKVHFKGSTLKLWEIIREELFKNKFAEPAIGDEPKQPRERSIERLMKEIGIPRVNKGKGKGSQNDEE